MIIKRLDLKRDGLVEHKHKVSTRAGSSSTESSFLHLRSQRTTCMHNSECWWYWDNNDLQVISDLLLLWSSATSASRHIQCCTTCAHAKMKSVFTFSTSIQSQRSPPCLLHSGAQTHPQRTHYWCFWICLFHMHACFPELPPWAMFSQGEPCRMPCKREDNLPKRGFRIKQIVDNISSGSE